MIDSSKFPEKSTETSPDISHINTFSRKSCDQNETLNESTINLIDDTKVLLIKALGNGAQIFIKRYDALLKIIEELKDKIKILESTPCTCTVQNSIAINSLKQQLQEAEVEKTELKQEINKLQNVNKNLKNINKNLKISKNRDNLTGALSRSYFDQIILILQREYKIDENKTFNIVLIDIDHFKVFNDLYGHPIGDFILKYFTNFIRSYLNEGGHINNSKDGFFRFGGEEFALLTRRSTEEVKQLITTILQELIQINLSELKELSHLENIPVLSFSAGIGGSYGLNSMNGISRVISQIDKALYESKDNGRSSINLCAADGSIDKKETINIILKDKSEAVNS